MLSGKKLKIILAFMLCLCAAAAMFYFVYTGKGITERARGFGEPDAVSSMSDGNSCRLTVVANASSIDDPENFAYRVAQMCRDNSFRTIRFSTDISGMPDEMDITVYLRKGDIGKEDPVMHIYLEKVSGKYKVSIDGTEIGTV